MPTCIEAQNVSYRTDGHILVEGVTFRVPKGDYVGIIGPNGGGKTTLLKLILGLLQPTTGKIRVFGKAPTNPAVRVRIGYVPQRVSQTERQFPATVEEIVWSGRAAKVGLGHSYKPKDYVEVRRALDIVEITHLRNQHIGTLSGGERQRVFIARALASRPEVLILDEPTAGVDARAEDEFANLLQRLNVEHHLTILFVTHDIDFITHAAKQVICLNHRMVCFGSPREFLTNEHLQELYGQHVQHYHHKH